MTPKTIGAIALVGVMVVVAAALAGYNRAVGAQGEPARSNVLMMTSAVASEQATSRPQSARAVSVYGFRSAEFGDDEKAIRKAIEKDFGIGRDGIAVRDNPLTGTRTLVIRTEKLLPDTGAAQIGYIIGYKSKGLAQVNIIWGTPVSAGAKGAEVARTAVMLKSYFAKLGFDPKRTVADRRLRNGGILVFRGSDKANHMVQLVYREADLKEGAATEGASKDDAVSTGKAADDETGETATVANGTDGKNEKKAYVLRLSYVLNPQHPDIIRIEKGAF